MVRHGKGGRRGWEGLYLITTRTSGQKFALHAWYFNAKATAGRQSDCTVLSPPRQQFCLCFFVFFLSRSSGSGATVTSVLRKKKRREGKQPDLQPGVEGLALRAKASTERDAVVRGVCDLISPDGASERIACCGPRVPRAGRNECPGGTGWGRTSPAF
ncbi:hypothetical protein EJ04DRAFT_27071 [Polyplosphaeria fusca]|uniref:Uncharacterized protein n=1 Tax=Polyplosphaeria fusca TaxID=682080 RepID=A0A9P4V6Z4_9PLEO|nr:hypothetical protein EJ04DRAFT_27071 [Polyplosphaeria fusca]